MCLVDIFSRAGFLSVVIYRVAKKSGKLESQG